MIKKKLFAAFCCVLAAAIVASLYYCKGKATTDASTTDSTYITEFPYVNEATAQEYANCATRIDSVDVAEKGEAIRNAKKLIAFDLDATITQHKTQMTPEAKATLDSLAKYYKLVMVGAGNAPRIYHQMNDYPIDIVANYGMQESKVIDGEFKIVREDTCKVDKEWFLTECNKLREKYGFTAYSGESVEFHESGMVTFGLLGTKATTEDKLAFDPDKTKRLAMYPEVLKIFKDYAVFIGGSTSFDFAEKKYNKYDALMRYAQENGFTKEEVLFVGDDFNDGGGDSHIRLGGMDYIQIYDYTTFPERMKFLYEGK